MEVGGVDCVVVVYFEGAYSGGGEVHEGGGAEATGSDDEDVGVAEGLLRSVSKTR